MSKIKLILENSIRSLKDSDGRIGLLTQTILLAFLLVLTLTSGSVQHYLADNLDQMLGSDLVIESHTELDKDKIAKLTAMTGELAQTALANITLTHKDRWARARLKLVGANYPLQGTLRLSDGLGTTEQISQNGPKEGDIWIGPRLAARLGLNVGDSLKVGDALLRVDAILLHEPDRIMEGHNVDMRAMVSHTNTTAMLGNDNRALHRYLLAANVPQRAEIEAWVSNNMPAATLIKKHGGQHPLSAFWTRTENFLGLASVLLFFMGAVALDMTNRRWLAKMRYRLALYTSFGTPMKTGITMAVGEWLVTFIATTVAALLLAFAAFGLIIGEMQNIFPGLEANPDFIAAAKTTGLVFLLLLALKAPSFIQLAQSSLLSLIRTQSEGTYIWHRLVFGLLSVSMLAVAYSDNWLLTGMTLFAVVIALALMLLLTWSIVKVGNLWGRHRTGLLPFSFFIAQQRLIAKSAQIMGLGLCGLLLLFTMMLMRDLGGMMESHARTHDGNLLVSQAHEYHVQALEEWAGQTGSSIRTLKPFVSAQLVAINGTKLDDYMQKPSDTLATLKDPIRLSWADQIPENNRLTGGTWWAQDTENWQQISTEPEVMTDMELEFGDRLTYQIEGKSYDFTLVASHAFKSGASSITFWFQVPGIARQHIEAPTRYMGSMELPETAWPALARLWQAHPSLSLAPLKELTERFDRTLAMVTKVTSGYAAMVLLLSLFVLAASVSGFRADDRLKNGLLMSMGFSNRDCLRLNFYDWGITALIAAIGAIAGTWIAGSLIYEEQFGLTYRPDLVWVSATVLMMVSTVCLIGYLACRQSLKVSVRNLIAA
ncbi:MAG: permease [Alphaproteobacteria bacterium]|nr:permease [Alphaproteobacteria bacterium]